MYSIFFSEYRLESFENIPNTFNVKGI